MTRIISKFRTLSNALSQASAIGYCCAISLIFAISSASAESSVDWKAKNSEAIAAMRAEKYEEAEKLFCAALSECKLESDKTIVKTNFALLLRKLGRENEADKLLANPHVSPFNDQAELAKPATNVSSEIKTEAPRAAARSADRAAAPTMNVNERIAQLDRAIKKADDSAALETLQELFQKRADAVLFRDKTETMEYAYTLHHRAQVLVHMHRDAEAKEIDTYAAKIRDQIRASTKKQSEIKH